MAVETMTSKPIDKAGVDTSIAINLPATTDLGDASLDDSLINEWVCSR